MVRFGEILLDEIKSKDIEKMTVEERNRHFFRLAYSYAYTFSIDPSTATGIVFVRNNKVISWGANFVPPGIEMTDEMLHSPAKYEMVAHAERVGVANAAYEGTSLKDSEAFIGWNPCGPCFGVLLFAGVSKLTTHKELNDLSAKLDERWGESQKYALGMIQQAVQSSGFVFESVSAKIGNDIPIRFKGKEYHL